MKRMNSMENKERIPFDIKYREDIESGKCSVVWCYEGDETKVAFPARIVCWDFGSSAPLLAACQKPGCLEEFSCLFKTDGTPQGVYGYRLYIERPETDMMRFEHCLEELIWAGVRTEGHQDFLIKTIALQYAPKLLELAKKVLVPAGYDIVWKPEKK